MKEIGTVLPDKGLNVHASIDATMGPGAIIGGLRKGQQVQVYDRRDTPNIWWREIVYHGKIRGWIAECRKNGKETFLSVEQEPEPKKPPPVDYDSAPLNDNDDHGQAWSTPDMEPKDWWFIGGCVVVALVILVFALLAVR